MITAEYGRDFWKQFKEISDNRFRELIAEFPDIGESMFALNYAYAPGYVAWWNAMEQLGLEQPYAESACRNSRVRLGYPVPGSRQWQL